MRFGQRKIKLSYGHGVGLSFLKMSRQSCTVYYLIEIVDTLSVMLTLFLRTLICHFFRVKKRETWQKNFYMRLI